MHVAKSGKKVDRMDDAERIGLLIAGGGACIWLAPIALDSYNSMLGNIASFAASTTDSGSALLAFVASIPHKAMAFAASILSALLNFIASHILELAGLVVLAAIAYAEFLVARAREDNEEEKAHFRKTGMTRAQSRALVREAEEARWKEQNRMWAEERKRKDEDELAETRREMEADRREKIRGEEEAERLELEGKEEQRRNEREKVLRREYHLKENLSEDEKEELQARGYVEFKVSPTGVGGASFYLVKKRHRESAEHAFFCYYIRDLVGLHTDAEIEMNEYRGSDVVFGHRGRRYAIEVETGTNYDKHYDYLEKRCAESEGEYEALLIFVTRKRLKRKYAKFGIVVTRATIRKELNGIFGRK